MSTESKELAKVEREPMEIGERGLVVRNEQDMMAMARYCIEGGYTPNGMNKVQAAAAIAHGMTVGLTPFQAVQSIAVINGRPTIWGDGAMAVIRASGLLEDVEEFTEGEGEQMVAVCRMKRKDQTSWCERRFSWQDAKRASLAGKATYKAYPARMLQMRARGFCARDTFADVLGGLTFREEVEDYQPRFDPDRMKSAGERKPSLSADEIRAKVAERVETEDAEIVESDEPLFEPCGSGHGDAQPCPDCDGDERCETCQGTGAVRAVTA